MRVGWGGVGGGGEDVEALPAYLLTGRQFDERAK